MQLQKEVDVQEIQVFFQDLWQLDVPRRCPALPPLDGVWWCGATALAARHRQCCVRSPRPAKNS